VLLCFCFFFFFQAEDGIRDFHVTGVQTCALPISSAKRKRKKHRSQMRKFEAAGGFRRIIAQTPEETRRLFDAFLEMKEKRFEARSEERRVGKECRTRWWA